MAPFSFCTRSGRLQRDGFPESKPEWKLPRKQPPGFGQAQSGGRRGGTGEVVGEQFGDEDELHPAFHVVVGLHALLELIDSTADQKKVTAGLGGQDARSMRNAGKA